MDWNRGCAWVLSMVVLGIPTAGAATKVVQIPSMTTTLTSTAKRMVSYRDQEHSWQTQDGAIHLMINRGAVSTDDSLALYSSFDNGVTWTQMFTLPGSNQTSTSDGSLTNSSASGATLMVAYGTEHSIGAIDFATATYDTTSQTWTLAGVTTAYSMPGFAGFNPAFTADDQGNLWLGFTVETLKTEQYQEQMLYQAVGTQTWVNTGLVFGSTDATTQHSARPVPYAGGVGVVYEDETTLYFAYRLDGWDITAPWVSQQLYSPLPPDGDDPYDTHFSVVADGQDNLYLAFEADMFQLLYTKFTTATGLWSTPTVLLGSPTAATYPEVSLAGGNIVILANIRTSVDVLQSTDSGMTFTVTQKLVHPTPAPGSTLSYANPRVESPRYATSPIPTFQQFVNGTTDGLLFFQVPVLN